MYYIHLSNIEGVSIGQIGRNDPCKCGSGKKYKKCCMQEDIKEQERLISNNCAICSKRIEKHEINRTTTMKRVIDNFKLQVTRPICSYKCSIAFDIKQKLVEGILTVYGQLL